MSTILWLVLLCAAPWAGSRCGEIVNVLDLISNRWRTFLGWVCLLSLAGALAVYGFYWLVAISLVFGFCLLREGRSYSQPEWPPYPMYRAPYISDDTTWGDWNRRPGHITPWARKSDLVEMQEGALGSIGSAAGAHFANYPPVIRRGSAKLVVNNGNFPPKGRSASRANLRVVK